jgi:hypothetical protein
MLEADAQSQARLIHETLKAASTFSTEQLAQLRALYREELADAGLRIDGPDHVDEAREDFRFVRKLRKGVNGTASKVGWVVIAALVSAAIWLFTSGLNFWRAGS